MFAWFNNSSNGGDKVRLSVVEEISELIRRSKRKCLVIVDAKAMFANYSPDIQTRPNSCFVIYCGVDKEAVKNVTGNAYATLTFSPACTSLFFCMDLLKLLKNYIEDFYMLSEAKLYEDFFMYVQKDFKLCSLCKTVEEFEQLVSYKTHNKGMLSDPIIKKIACISDSALLSNAIHSAVIDSEHYTMNKDGLEYTLTVRSGESADVIGPMNKSMVLEIRDEETSRRVKLWNTRMKELQLDALMIKPRILIEKDISPRTEKGEDKALEGLKNPWMYESSSMNISSDAAKVLDTISRIHSDKDAFIILSIILANLTKDGRSIVPLEDYVQMKATSGFKRLIVKEQYGSIFYVMEKNFFVKPAYKCLTRFKYSMGKKSNVIEYVIPLD